MTPLRQFRLVPIPDILMLGSIELDGMDSGVYIVKVITKEGETYMSKLVKE